MALWRDGVSITVEIAFASDPQATSPTWTDVTDYVREVPAVFRGRQDEYGDFAPGMATVVLDNRDRRFDPEHSAGAYYPNVLPMKRLKITWAFAATSGLVFTGYIQGWPQEEMIASDAWVTVTAVDGSRFIEQDELAASAYATEVLADSPIVYWPMQETDATVSSVVDVADSGITLGLSAAAAPTPVTTSAPIGQTSALAGSSAVNIAAVYSSSPKIDNLSAPKTLEMWVDFADVTNDMEAKLNVGATDSIRFRFLSSTGLWLNYSNASDNKTLSSASAEVDAGYLVSLGMFHLAVRCDTSNAYVYANGQLVATAALSTGTISLSSNAYIEWSWNGDTSLAISHFAAYSTDIGAARIQAHYLAGLHAHGHPVNETGGTRIGRALDDVSWPSGLRDIDAGQTPQGPYRPAGQTAMAYCRQVERSEQGLLFFDVSGNLKFVDRQAMWKSASVATFSDDGAVGAVKYTEAIRGSTVDTIRNIVTASYAAVGGITRRDATSRTAYGDARESIDSPTLPTGESASTLAAYVLRERKDPDTVISMLSAPLRISGGDNEAETLLAIDIGDLVTLERTPSGVGSQVVKTCVVQGVGHRIDPSRWVVDLYLSPAPTSNTAAPYLTLGDATLGKIGAVAGNLIPF